MVTTITRAGTWEAVFGRRSQSVKAIADDLRSLVIGLHPDAIEMPRKDKRLVSFGFGEKKIKDAYCTLSPQTDRVKVSFVWGGGLEDPNGLLKGKGKKLRHVEITDQRTARSAKIAHLMHLAIEERRAGLGI